MAQQVNTNQRKLASKISPQVIKFLADEYTRNKYITLEKLAIKYNSTIKFLSKLLFRGISEDILSDDVADKIFNKIVNCYEFRKKQRATRWQEAFDLRDSLRLEKVKALKNSKKLELEHKVSSYDNYFIEDDEGAPSKESLQQELDALTAC